MPPCPHASTAYRGRFAPSPTGPLHLGSLLAAFGSWLLARHAGGEWLVRIEDVDRAREVPGAAARQLDTLAAFGLVPDRPPVHQSQRHALYQAALEQLKQAGAAFPCACSRSELAAQGGIHRHCIATAARGRPAWRLRVPDGLRIGFDDGLQGRYAQDLAAEVGDFVLRRADGYWAYQLAVVVDDADQGITDIVRGADLLASTPRQIWLQRCLGYPTPSYAHLPVATNPAGEKWSKQTLAPALVPQAASRQLWQALHFLGQAVPDELQQAPLSDLWGWALTHWSLAAIPRQQAISAAADPG